MLSRMSLRAVIIGAALLVAVPDATATKRTPITGYADVTLGMTYQDVITLFGIDAFNPVSVQKCEREMATRGCQLSQLNEAKPVTIIAGIPLHLVPEFDTRGRITDVSFRSSALAKDEATCLAEHDRLFDWVTTTYGPLYVLPMKVLEGDTLEQRKTAGGASYALTRGATGNLSTSMARTLSRPPATPPTGAPYDWDGERSVQVSGMLLQIAGKPKCWLSVIYREPGSVKRPAATTP